MLLRQLTMKLVRVRIARAALAALTLAIVLGRGTPVRTQDVTAQAGTAPAPGDVIFNEYMSDNDANGNDFVELLVMRDGVDLRGLRFSDNEFLTATGTLNNNEAVFIFGNDDYLSNVPRGTLIAVYQLAAGVVTDTVVDPSAGDWKMVLAPGTGITGSTDGLGGAFNAGLAVAGEALYLYLPGPNGNSSGTDNIYIDFMSYEADGGDPPPGMVDINLPSVADNAYYTGNTAAGNDVAANWVRYDNAPNASTTPGDPNPGQDLSPLRTVTPTAGVTVTESGGSTSVVEGGPTDTYTIALKTTPAGTVQIQASSDARTEVSSDGFSFGHTAVVSLTSTTAATITVRAVDDGIFQGSMTSTIAHSIVNSADPAYSDALTPVASVVASVGDNDTPIVPIHDIQGSGAFSVYADNNVVTRGIVTGIKNNGFFIQEPDDTVDGQAETSEGIQVFTSSAPTVTRGDYVQVSGRVSEFIPAADPFQPPLTEIVTPTISVLSTGNQLPAPVEITIAMTTAPNAEVLLERLEGMRVSVPSMTVTGPTLGSVSEPNATGTSNGIFYGVVTGTPRPFREAGIDFHDPLPPGSPCCVPRFDGNVERLRVDSDAQAGAAQLTLTSGVVVTGMVGPLDYGFRTYTLLPDAGTATVTTPNAVFRAVPAASTDEVTIAGLNFERFFDTVNDPGIGEPVLTATAFDNRLNKASLTLRNVLRLPDVVGVVEMENLTTLQMVATRVNADAVAAGGTDPQYAAYLVEGNDVGGIDVGFLVKATRVDALAVHQEGKNTTYINPNNGQSELLNDRPPLVLDARATRSDGSSFEFTVVVNHLRSLLGTDDPVDGPRVRAKRRAQAEFLATLLQDMQTANPGVRVLAIGDFNAFEVNDGYVDMIGTARGVPAPANQVVLASSDLVNPDLVDLVTAVPAGDRYSYVFDGNAQVLDHALANVNLLPWVSRFAFSRSNADFPEATRSDATRPERLTDHDGTMTYLALGTLRITGRIVGASPRSAGGQVTVDVQVTNMGGGNALGVTIDSLTLRTLGGSGTVTPATALPIAVGSLAPGQTTTVSIVLNVPDGVTRFAMIENGSATDAGGAVSHFMLGTATSSIITVR